MEFDPEQNKIQYKTGWHRDWIFIVMWDAMDDAIYPRYKRGWYGL